MKLMDIVHRSSRPEPWAEGEKIPWHDPAFSQRMLKEHLSQAHDAASRRFETIDKHVRWIHNSVLKGSPTRVLDLGCGPGLYTSRLASLGHQCVGIDFSPASIAYAGEQAGAAGLDCRYYQADVRAADYGTGYGLVMSIFGELNVFRPAEAQAILTKAARALIPHGWLLLEPHTFEQVAEIGKKPPAWHSSAQGVFSDTPHFCLEENFWNEDKQVAIQRYYIIDAATGAVACHSSSMQAYTDEQYRALLADSGFGEVLFYPAQGEGAGGLQSHLPTILARRNTAG